MLATVTYILIEGGQRRQAAFDVTRKVSAGTLHDWHKLFGGVSESVMENVGEQQEVFEQTVVPGGQRSKSLSGINCRVYANHKRKTLFGPSGRMTAAPKQAITGVENLSGFGKTN